MKNREYISFGSGTTNRDLSNLYAAPVTLCAPLDPALLLLSPKLRDWCSSSSSSSFPSIEQLWHALKAKDKETFLRFTTAGDLGAWSPDFFAATTAAKKEAKLAKSLGLASKTQLSPEQRRQLAFKCMNYWKKFNLIGIVAKLAANPEYGPSLRLGEEKMDYRRETLPADLEQSVWMVLLRLKYTQNPGVHEKLQGTGAAVLYELDRHSSLQRPSHWGGKLDVSTGQIIGENVMGVYLSRVREELVLS
jgi:hypothetical protein